MNRWIRRGFVPLVCGVLVACVAQRDGTEATRQVAEERDDTPTVQRAVETKVQKEIPVAPAPEPQKTAADKRGNRVAKVDEVQVTGTRRQESPQEMPVPVSVISSEQLGQLKKSGLASVADFSSQSACCPQPNYQQRTNTEQYEHLEDNPVHLAAEQPVSTLSIDVDTGSYANVRRFLNAGQLPPADAVRVEEMINYFDYNYAPPKDRSTPFKVATELAAAPWNSNALLLKIGIKGFEIAANERPATNLVFLIDVSGSMYSADKLPLLKNAFHLLTDQLTAKDRVSIVVYAGNSGMVLEPTAGDQKHKIHEALDRLEAGGSTNGAQGIKLAYQLAHDTFIKDGVNRVVLATDGDFNVGVVNFDALLDMAKQQRATGIALTTLGFGTGNYNDKLLERLADAGNGNYAYVDTLSEARKVLVSELSATLYTIAKDVKIQVEFNPAEVREYRLIGYENRKLAREDFNNDKVDAGDIGAGHRVTALYEVVLNGNKGYVDTLRYGTTAKAGAANGEVANVRVRYKKPDSDTSTLLEYPIVKSGTVSLEKASPDFRFAASVAAFGQLLRGGKYVARYDYDDVAKLAKAALGDDTEGYRREFVSLVKLAGSMTPKAERSGQRVGLIAK